MGAVDHAQRALLHLEDAELAILSHIGAESVALQSDEEVTLPDLTPMLYAVLRSVARAAGLLEGMPTEYLEPSFSLEQTE